MNLLPKDLLQLLYSYLTPWDIAFTSKDSLIEFIGLDRIDLNDLWNFPNYIYPDLTDGQRWIRVLAYFNIPVKGSEQFLGYDNSFDLAISHGQTSLVQYFIQKGNLNFGLKSIIEDIYEYSPLKAVIDYKKGKKVSSPNLYRNK